MSSPTEEVKQVGLQLVNEPNFPAQEEQVLKYWQEIKAFETSQELSKGKPDFNFYDGPPFATGLPHYGHILAGTIKDVVCISITSSSHHSLPFISRLCVQT